MAIYPEITDRAVVITGAAAGIGLGTVGAVGIEEEMKRRNRNNDEE